MKACKSDQVISRPLGRVFLIGCAIFSLAIGNLLAQEDMVTEEVAEEINPV